MGDNHRYLLVALVFLFHRQVKNNRVLFVGKVTTDFILHVFIGSVGLYGHEGDIYNSCGMSMLIKRRLPQKLYFFEQMHDYGA